jgi:uroporphyrin-III C-methyltransferase/precorrin-2 dehydrogenase/sirohydrochlorin ferrochelatase
VIVLGEGAPAEAKRRLVERAGGQVVADLEAGIEAGAGLAFVAVDDAREAEAAADRLRAAGVLVNVADRPELCDFMTPSILDRDPVQVAIGTDGASAGLAKHLRLRLEAVLPDGIGRLARSLGAAREALRERWPNSAERRAALDAALEPGGALDPMVEHAADAVTNWLTSGTGRQTRRIELTITTRTPD